MYDEPQAEFRMESKVERSGTPHDQFTGAFFPQSENLVVAGGQFKSIATINHAARGPKLELIPAQQIFEKYCGSHLATVYLWAYLVYQYFADAEEYIGTVSGKRPRSVDCTIWIRPSTGRLCLDFDPPEDDGLVLYTSPGSLRSLSFLVISILDAPKDSKILDLISLDLYHENCAPHFAISTLDPISTNEFVQLGAVISCPTGSGVEHSKEIAFLPDLDLVDSGWKTTERKPLLVMENGWTRVNSCDLMDAVLSRDISCDYGVLYGWLGEANHIFNFLGIRSNHDDYVEVYCVSYKLKLSSSRNGIRPGYLFLCPVADLQSGSPYFRHPECSAYRSPDPRGAKRLSIAEAEHLGFPHLELTMEAYAESWDESIYSEIHQFHQAKGFDPDSLDVAREVGYPLFEISPAVDGMFAHVTEVDGGRADSEHGEVPLFYEYPSEYESKLDSPLLPETTYYRNDPEMPEPSKTWRIIMGAQLTLILILSSFSLYEYYLL